MVQYKAVKSVLNKHKKRDSWFLDDYSINPYEGCSCNCQYCYIRGSKYGENMENGMWVKSNALEVLDKQLYNRAKKDQYGIVVVGSATDAWLPLEKETAFTRGMLELLLKYRFPVFISTKSSLVLRDVDLLQQIDATAILPPDLQSTLQRGVIFTVSLSTVNDAIACTLEPGALPPLQRLEVLQQMKAAGFLTGVNAMPLLPFITDEGPELEAIFAAGQQHGAEFVLAAGLTLFGNAPADSKTLYYHFLNRFNPSLVARYDQLYNGYPYPPRHYHAVLKERTDALCVKYGVRNAII